MRESRPVIALDFPSFEEAKEFLAPFSSRGKTLCQGRNGNLLCSRSRSCALFEIIGT